MAKDASPKYDALRAAREAQFGKATVKAPKPKPPKKPSKE
jgi:hypothetical protein